jgi:mRNA interferase HigB
MDSRQPNSTPIQRHPSGRPQASWFPSAYGRASSDGSQYANIGPVWVISRKRLKECWERHPQAEVPLRAWFQVASKAEWQHIADVRRDFPHADAVGRWTVFNIGGNDYRLVVEIAYMTHKVYVRFVGTHQEYDKGRWK